MKLIRRLTFTTRTRRSIRVVGPACGVCPVCGSVIGTTGSAETADSPMDDGMVLSPIDDGRVHKIPRTKQLRKKE